MRGRERKKNRTETETEMEREREKQGGKTPQQKIMPPPTIASKLQIAATAF